jgi:malate dehydrogenase (oxaloacetate-decarboxylating)(NADP+)
VRYYIMNKAKAASPKKRIVFAEGEEAKIIRAAAQILDEEIGIPILVGREWVIRGKLQSLGLDDNMLIVDPENSPP